MTTMMRRICTCSVCGAENEISVLGSTNAFGSPDLDFRPAQMLRGTMYLWLQECRGCGYVSKDISAPAGLTRFWLKSQEYLTCDGIPFSSDLAKRFYREYLISAKEKRMEDSFFAILHAAWACDDLIDVENAMLCRKKALSILNGPLHSIWASADEKGEKNEDIVAHLRKRLRGQSPNKGRSFMVMRADIMRRAGLFDELIEEYDSVHFREDNLNQIIRFQIERAKEKDAACYRIQDVTGE